MPGQMERLVIDTTTNDAKNTNNSGPMRKFNLDIGKSYTENGENVGDGGGGIVNKGHTCEKDNLSDSGFEINDVRIFIAWAMHNKKPYTFYVFVGLFRRDKNTKTAWR